MSFSPKESLRQLREYDQNRPGFPGEHWLALGAGVALMMATRNSDSWIKRSLGLALGGALVARAASGQDGLVKLVDYLPQRAD